MSRRERIVGSAHLVSDEAAELSEFEFGLITAGNAFVLNIEDTHTVTYALKKLQRLGLVESTRQGKESFWRVSAEGAAACQRYREVREACLLEVFQAFAGERRDGLNAEIGGSADLLRALSGLYDQAARAAASL